MLSVRNYVTWSTHSISKCVSNSIKYLYCPSYISSYSVKVNDISYTFYNTRKVNLISYLNWHSLFAYYISIASVTETLRQNYYLISLDVGHEPNEEMTLSVLIFPDVILVLGPRDPLVSWFVSLVLFFSYSVVVASRETFGNTGFECFPSEAALGRVLACLESSSSASDDSAAEHIGSEVGLPTAYFRQSKMEQCLVMVPEGSLAGSRWA